MVTTMHMTYYVMSTLAMIVSSSADGCERCRVGQGAKNMYAGDDGACGTGAKKSDCWLPYEEAMAQAYGRYWTLLDYGDDDYADKEICCADDQASCCELAGLGPGAIAGIVIGIIVFFTVLILLFCVCCPCCACHSQIRQCFGCTPTPPKVISVVPQPVALQIATSQYPNVYGVPAPQGANPYAYATQAPHGAIPYAIPMTTASPTPTTSSPTSRNEMPSVSTY